MHAGTERYESRLDDGTALLFRLIEPDDKAMLLEGFERLSEHSRYERFFTHLQTLSPDRLRYLTEVDHHNHSAWVALAQRDAGPTGAGVGRWIRLPDAPALAEVAVTVVDEFHRRGIGRTLLYLCAQSAWANGVKEFRASVLGDNRATLKMLDRIGARQGRWESGVFELTVPLAEMVTRRDLVPLSLSLVGGRGDPA